MAVPPPRKPSRRRRASWHKPLGLAVVVLGVLIVLVNDLALVGADTPLPGGHSELYLFAGVLIGGLGAWFTGLFDPV